jgi:hypothetical protein
MFFFVSGIYRPFVVVYSGNNYYDVYPKGRIMARGLHRSKHRSRIKARQQMLCGDTELALTIICHCPGVTSQSAAVWGRACASQKCRPCVVMGSSEALCKTLLTLLLTAALSEF